MLTCIEIATFLDSVLSRHLYPEEIPAIWKESPRPIKRLGLALEPDSYLAEWIKQEAMDAVFLHRPWKLATYPVPDDITFFSSHLPFDEQLTVGFNRILANRLKLTDIKVLGTKEGRPVGMSGTIPVQMDAAFCKILDELFQGLESSFQLTGKTIHKVAFVGAMTAQLIENAANQGVELYCTGQFREPARRAALATSMSIVAVGHKRSELFGLSLLADLLSTKWPELTIIPRIPAI
ncbi:Nif3-like dinuclear metal center hexameric protein [Rhodocytophaga aerolata]|uniref:Nif3-like dinuclear metal center hexameric protein n=1 Tax=Rhodocytophaga aerolata TaxID=455078 RepID=A0ABT8RA08_9BACT|nr:Nif3-like dinuclear metal center hexameric protein [Rhodocytophaga aerolata]MDO1448926.1 Nif3-like dinuclear metal center hexameric protein [Rhodocytophaga aerolata]